jgi:predicted transcriptional regulator
MKNLRSLGLSATEQRVYLTLLDSGVTSVAELSQLANIKRTTLYSSLEELKQKGLVSEITNEKKKYFQAVSPRGLKKLIENKINELRVVEKIIPEMLEKYQSAKKLRKRNAVKTYKGVVSLPDLIGQVANSKTNIYFLGSIKGLQHYLGFDLLEKIYTRPRRHNLKITDYLITDWAVSTIQRFHEEAGMFSQTRFLPPDMEPRGCFVAFEDKLIVGQLFPKPTAMVFEDQTMVSLFKMAFGALWKDLEGKYIPPRQSQ